MAAKATLERLQPLIGRWEMEASIDGRRTAHGWTTFEPLEGGAYVVQRADADPPTDDTPAAWIENSPFPTLVVIGADDFSGTFAYCYSDARGVHRVYRMSVEDGVWRIWGQSGPEFFQRYEGELSADGSAIVGHWDRSPDGSAWERDFDGVYTRVG
jgi:hypothetical protein